VKRFWLRLIPEQPLRLDDDHLIPAAALCGAIAAVALSGCVYGHEHDMGPCGTDCRYWSLFGEGVKLKIGTAYAGAGDETRPFLATARTCAKVSGFKAAGGHGIFDIAIRQWLFEHTAADQQRLAGVYAPYLSRCLVCGAELIPCEGTYTRQGEREFAQVGEVSNETTVTFTTMNTLRKQVTANHHMTGRAMNRGVYYAAPIEIPDPLEGLFRQIIGGGLVIGGGRSRGMGQVRTELVPMTAPAVIPMTDRIARFNRAVRAEQRYYSAMAATTTSALSGEDGDWYFTLDLREPVVTDYCQPSIIPSLPLLSTVTAQRHWLKASKIGGWNAAAGLPRAGGLGAAGVIVYRVSADTNRATVEELLAFIEAEGIGIDRERGFGDVTVCDPFHLFMEPL
jgi:CRISPR-associated Csx10 family RAMP protein